MTDYQKQSPMQAIEVNNIKKSYENKYALGQPDSKEGISFSVSQGELFGIIGPDGAGKTSLIQNIDNSYPARQRTASIDGLDIIKDIKRSVIVSDICPVNFLYIPTYR